MHSVASSHPRNSGERALLSHSTILILSGYLIGVGCGPEFAAGMGTLVVGAGLSGILAYGLLRLAASRRRRRAAELAMRRALRDLEIRVDRHIPRQGLLRRPRVRQFPVPTHQYVTVVGDRARR